MKLRLFLLQISVVFSLLSSPVFAINEQELVEKLANGESITGWIHAAVPQYQQYVFTWRDPENFFDAFEYPMIPATSKLRELFSQLKRHDKVEAKGRLVENPSSLRHFKVTELKVLEPFESPVPMPPHEYEAIIPEELQDSDNAVFKVHAVVNEGRVLVVEYKDAILPVFVRENSLTKELFRGDKIRLFYKLRTSPGRPQHIELNGNLEILRRMPEGHNQSLELTGYLVMFPKSPQIAFNVFALQHIDEDKVKTEYTLVNFDDQELFANIRKKLQAAWDHSASQPKNDRNKLVKTNIRVHAQGIKNVVSPNQANPQILIKNLEHLRIEMY